MKHRWVVWSLVGIIVLAAVLRLWNIGGNPPSLSWDEVSIGYNAYSILTTGRDEHGIWFPLNAFAAFGDYKPPIPVYLTVPFVWIFGLNELSVRLPSAISGILSVLVLFFVVRLLFLDSGKKDIYALTASLLMAITPWHIMLSRAGFEANIAVLWILVGVYCVLAARVEKVYWRVTWIPFVLGMYTFNSARYAGPLIAAGVLAYSFRSFWKAKRDVSIGIIVACILLIPLVPHLLSKQARLRYEEVSIFTDPSIVLTANARITADRFSKVSAVFDNRRIGYFLSYASHFFDNLEPRFLFIWGDGNPKFSIRDTGQLLLVTAPFLAVGALSLMAHYPSLGFMLLWWLLASIIPAAVARETPHALRVENGLPVYMIVTSFGVVSVVTSLKRRLARGAALLLIVGALLINGGYFWHAFTAHYPKEFSGEWQYGYKQAIAYIDSVRDSYDRIVLTESIGRPYIYVLFYDRTNPQDFWRTKDASFDAAGFYNVYGFGKYRFVAGLTKSDSLQKTLYVMSPKDVPSTAHIVHTISLLNGNPVLVAFDSL